MLIKVVLAEMFNWLPLIWFTELGPMQVYYDDAFWKFSYNYESILLILSNSFYIYEYNLW